jgi:hypothetical protein
MGPLDAFRSSHCGYASAKATREEILVTAPDHVENTGDNLRHAAEVTHSPQQDDEEGSSPPELPVDVNPLPDFNT